MNINNDSANPSLKAFSDVLKQGIENYLGREVKEKDLKKLSLNFEQGSNYCEVVYKGKIIGRMQESVEFKTATHTVRKVEFIPA